MELTYCFLVIWEESRRNKDSYTTSYEDSIMSLSQALHIKTKTLANADAEKANWEDAMKAK